MKEGVAVALKEKPRPGKQRLLNDKQETELVAMACSAPPPKRWYIPIVTAVFLKAMFVILDLYAQPYDERHPQVNFDEKSKELHEDVKPPQPTRSGKVARQDYEYKRCGTRNLFLFVEPKAGKRHVLVTRRRTKLDFSYAMRYMVDVLYPVTE